MPQPLKRSVVCVLIFVAGLFLLSSCGGGKTETQKQPTPQAENKPPAAQPNKPSTFDQFWGEFTTAIKADDKAKLFSLIRAKEFHWETGDLDLKPREAVYYFETEDDFTRNYSKIFNPQIKDKILNGKPTKVPAEIEFYEINWKKGHNEYSLTFDKNEKEGYRFSGLLVGPA